MAKKRQIQPENRRIRAMSYREAEERRKVLAVLGVVVAVIFVALMAGAIQNFVIRPNQPIAVVDGVEIAREDYENRVLYERYLIDEQIAAIQAQAQQLAASLGDSPELLQSLQDQAGQQINRLASQRLSLDRQALDLMIEEQLVLVKAKADGIDVSPEEVNRTYEDIAAARQGGYTEVSASETVEARQNATSTAANFTPTPTFTPTATLEPTPTPEATLAATDPTTATTSTLDIGEIPDFEIDPNATIEPLPTPTINVLAGQALNDAVSQWETTIQENTNMTPEDLRNLVYYRLLRDEVAEAIGQDVPTTTLQVHARHILVETEEDAISATNRLAAGEDFGVLAQTVSIDTGTAPTGGDLGWFAEGDMVAGFQDAAFSLEVGQVSEPIETQFGWHIIEVLERGDRELEGGALSRARNRAYNDWLTDIIANPERVKDLWVPSDAPAETNDLFKQ